MNTPVPVPLISPPIKELVPYMAQRAKELLDALDRKTGMENDPALQESRKLTHAFIDSLAAAIVATMPEAKFRVHEQGHTFFQAFLQMAATVDGTLIDQLDVTTRNKLVFAMSTFIDEHMRDKTVSREEPSN